MLEEITFSRLQKLSLPVEQPEDLSMHGTIYAYDKAYDAVNTRNDKPLQTIDMVKYNTTTSEDPIILDLAQKDQATVFTTDAILSVLMCAPRSVNSWDIVITKENGKLYLDKREGGVFDFLTVNENAADPPADSDRPDDINSSGSLSLEATYINANFACQVVDDTKRKAFKNPNPFYSTDETEPLASCAYRYRKFDLSVPSDEDEFNMIVRTEVTAYQGKKDQYITIKALNEFDSKAQGSGKAPDWRTRLDAQRGAVVATEMKNNSAKLARWATQSLLAGAEMMKVGFVSRANPKDAQRHVIVGMQSYKPRDFAAQMNISLNNGWGIVRMIVDLVNKQPDGRYVLVKDPNNPFVRLYAVPANAFDPVEEDIEEAEEEEDEE
jgi:translation initiation factor 3 subunit D